jgi:putative transcriptional regulator
MKQHGIIDYMILIVCALFLVLVGYFHGSAGKTADAYGSFTPLSRDNVMLPRTSRSVPGLSSGKFLVAGQNIGDPRFYRTVILLVKHDRRGSVGIIINRPTPAKISDALPEAGGLRGGNDPVFYGGPVGIDQVQMLFQSGADIDEARRVFDDVFFSSSGRTIRRMIIGGGRDERFRVYAGYAGWNSGQLEHEITRGDWLILRADADTVFHADPSAIWTEMIQRVSGRLWVFNQYPKRKESVWTVSRQGPCREE